MDDDMFNLLDNPDCDADFASSISSSSSQMDYDKMAMDAMAEIDELDVQPPLVKPSTLHDYQSRPKWDNSYNQSLPNKIKNDKIEIIEEDIENEIDSEYSMTLKKGDRRLNMNDIKQEFEFEFDMNLQQLDISKDSINKDVTFSSNSSCSSLNDSRRLRKDRKTSPR